MHATKGKEKMSGQLMNDKVRVVRDVTKQRHKRKKAGVGLSISNAHLFSSIVAANHPPWSTNYVICINFCTN